MEHLDTFQNSSIDHPKHYNDHPVAECIDIAEHFNFNLGNAIKYIWRAGLKPGNSASDDLRKASWYCLREAEKLDKEKRSE